MRQFKEKISKFNNPNRNYTKWSIERKQNRKNKTSVSCRIVSSVWTHEYIRNWSPRWRWKRHVWAKSNLKKLWPPVSQIWWKEYIHQLHTDTHSCCFGSTSHSTPRARFSQSPLSQWPTWSWYCSRLCLHPARVYSNRQALFKGYAVVWTKLFQCWNNAISIKF